MTGYKILCYRDSFESYKRITNDRIREIPASAQDDFALLVCVNNERQIGFDKSSKALDLLGLLFKGCYSASGDKMLQVAQAASRYSGGYTFKPRCSSFENMIREHEKFELDAKKFEVMSRNGRSCPQPNPKILTPFLKSSKRPITLELYRKLIETCHYVAIEVVSGEHGFGAFEVFSDDLSKFFSDLKSLMDDSGELLFVEHYLLPYH